MFHKCSSIRRQPRISGSFPWVYNNLYHHILLHKGVTARLQSVSTGQPCTRVYATRNYVQLPSNRCSLSQRKEYWSYVNGDPKCRPPKDFEWKPVHIEAVFRKSVVCWVNGWKWGREQFVLHRIKFELNFQGVKITRMQFPVLLSFDCTAHEAQVQTLAKVLVDFRSNYFSSGQLYVSPSHVRKI